MAEPRPADGPHPATLPIDRLLADCEIQRTKRGGPGGQHRNKVETAIVVTHQPTGVRGEAGERRSQEQNRRQALFRLRRQLALDVRTTAGEQPSQLWQSRRQGQRINVADQHDDLPALLAEALNMLHAERDDASAAAERLGVSTSQLIKLIKQAPPALEQLNDRRQKQGLRPYR